MKTFSTTPKDIKREWLLVDADGVSLGRLASQVAMLLRGKHKPYFVPHLDTGDFVVVINADKVKLTGNKEESKVYRSHSGYLGGLKERRIQKIRQQKPTFPVHHAVKGMLPHNRLGRVMIKKLKVYAGPQHPHLPQAPTEIKLTV